MNYECGDYGVLLSIEENELEISPFRIYEVLHSLFEETKVVDYISFKFLDGSDSTEHWPINNFESHIKEKRLIIIPNSNELEYPEEKLKEMIINAIPDLLSKSKYQLLKYHELYRKEENKNG